MEIDILSAIKACNIFATASDEALETLIPQFEKVKLRKNQRLLRQGELSNDFYLLLAGRLTITVKTANHPERLIGLIHPGESVGELSALSQEPRSATVKATESSVLLKLSGEIFKEFCLRYSTVLTELIRTLNQRSRNTVQLLSNEEPQRKHIVIIPAHSKVNLDKFLPLFVEQIAHLSDAILLSEYDPTLHERYPTTKELQQAIGQARKKNKTVFYLLHSRATLLSKIALKRTCKIYVIANENSRIYLSPFTRKQINENQVTPGNKAELILLHEHANKLPRDTIKWLKLAKFGLYHHLRLTHISNYQRILRFMMGRAVGVVLGGGGVRSWAHVGALHALRKMKIPIDILVGTSAGALVAGYYGFHETCKDPKGELRELSAITRKTVSWRNFTWPAISLFDGKAYTKQLIRIFGKTRLENLWLPSICVACNLSRNKQIALRTGYVWKVVRGSTAVPAVFPPVEVNGEIYLDGGIQNNLPVDVMRKLLSHQGTVIAIELTRNSVDTNQYHFPPVLPFWKTILAKLKLGFRSYRFPSFIDTFLKSLLAGSVAKQEENALKADVLISPDLGKFSLLQISEKDEQALIEAGYAEAMKVIKTSAALKDYLKKNE